MQIKTDREAVRIAHMYFAEAIRELAASLQDLDLITRLTDDGIKDWTMDVDKEVADFRMRVQRAEAFVATGRKELELGG